MLYRIMRYGFLTILIVVIINLAVTVKVVKSMFFTKTQKSLQIVLVWILPIIGALLIYFFHKDDETPKGPRKPPFGGGYGESGSVISGGSQ